MGAYIVRRLLLIIPTLLGIMVVNFLIIQAAPGGPVELVIAQLRGHDVGALARVSGGGGETTGAGAAAPAGGAAGDEDLASKYRGARGLDPDFIHQLEKQFGFDEPPPQRFLHMLRRYMLFDFGTSFYSDRRVISLVLQRLPVSISLGLWTTLIIYLVSIPLGIAKAVRDGSRFDTWTSTAVIVGYAIPAFLFAILLVVLFAGGSYLKWFPLRGLTSDYWGELAWPARILDYLWHMTLPLAAMVIGGFATLTLLTKNSFLEEISKQYVVAARAKGLTRRRVLYGHIFRNGMLIVVAGFPGAFASIFFTAPLLIEVIFSLNGLGLLGFEAAINRDYPIMFGTLYVGTLISLVLHLVSDLTYVVIDPRIDFARREF